MLARFMSVCASFMLHARFAIVCACYACEELGARSTPVARDDQRSFCLRFWLYVWAVTCTRYTVGNRQDFVVVGLRLVYAAPARVPLLHHLPLVLSFGRDRVPGTGSTASYSTLFIDFTGRDCNQYRQWTQNHCIPPCTDAKFGSHFYCSMRSSSTCSMNRGVCLSCGHS